MPTFEFTSPEGKTYTVQGPEGATQEQAFQILQGQLGAKSSEPRSRMEMLKDEALTSLPGSLLRGAKDVVDTGAEYLAKGYDKLTGQGPTVRGLVTGEQSGEAARVKAMNDAGDAEFAAAAERTGAGIPSKVARVGGQIVAVGPVGPALGAAAKAGGLTRLGNALASGGMTTGAAVAPGVIPKAVDMGIRMAGGGATGYASAGMIDPDAANTGGVIGALLPPAAKVAGAAGDVTASLIRPFTKGGQERIAGDVLRRFSTNPNALRNIQQAREVVPGSMPTAVMASGDEGLAGLSRTMQSVDGRYAAELSTRAAANNAARTAALEGVAGNTGKLALAKEARDAATGPMRESVLDAAGSLPAKSVLDALDRLLTKPDNAGKLSQQALNAIKNQIAGVPGMHGNRVGGFVDESGNVSARALYAIRKDINDTLSGKLQGEAGNLRLASGQLLEVKKVIDQAIDQASRRVEMSSSRALMPAGANIERAGMAPPVSSGPRATWQGYLDEYTQRSIPINQMEKLDEVMKAISTGTVDQGGNAVLSAAKLNNLLRNQAGELQKALAPEQLNLLRRMAADLNASQLASNAGKAVGSNTVQNLAQTNVLASVLGAKLGASTPAQSALARLLQLPYGASNKMIQERLGNALLNPQEAARLMADPKANALLRALSSGGEQIGYRAAPAISAQ